MLMREVLLYFSLKYKGDFSLIMKALKQKEDVDEKLFEQLTLNLHSSYVTIIDDDYPRAFKNIGYPPFVLYYYGNLSLAEQKSISVIGMRQASSYGLETTEFMVKDLVDNDFTIVSGMAKGIDSMAHRSAINHRGDTIAVLGSGIDYVYPYSSKDIYDELKRNQLVMSEYPGDEKPHKQYFRNRNRLISGLGDALLVIEASKRSGTMITVGYALDQGKDVFCIPARITDAIGCNYMIQQGAKLVMNIDDILDEWSS